MPLRRISGWWNKQKLNWYEHNALAKVEISLKNGKPIYLGEGQRKVAYHGHAYFKTDKGKSKVPVAIKAFKTPITSEAAHSYNELIRYLRDNRFPIPKSAMIQVTKKTSEMIGGVAKPGEWIAIQQFFGKQKKTKIVDRQKEVVKMLTKLQKNKLFRNGEFNDFSLLFLGKKIARTDAAILFSKFVNLGINPRFDIVAPLKSKGRVIGAIPFDLDLIIEEAATKNKLTPGQRAINLLDLIKQITPSVKERHRLIQICMREIKSSEIRGFLSNFKDSSLAKNIDFSEIDFFQQ